MGNKALTKQERAIRQDGVLNVEKTALLVYEIRQAEQQAITTKLAIQEQIEIKLQAKQALIERKDQQMTQILKERQITMQRDNPNSTQKLQAQQGRSLKQLSGYFEARNILEDLKKKARRIHRQQKSRLLVEIQQLKANLIENSEKNKQPLPALSRLGDRKKNIILQSRIQKNSMKQKLQQSKEKLQSEFSTFKNFEHLYSSRIENQLPDRQVQRVVKDFQENLMSVTQIKSGCVFC